MKEPVEIDIPIYLMGAIAVSWTRLDKELFSMLAEITGMSFIDARLVYFGIRNMRTRIEIMETLLKQRDVDDPIRKTYKPLLTKSKKINSRRNSLTHDIWMRNSDNQHELMDLSSNIIKFKPIDEGALMQLHRDIAALSREMLQRNVKKGKN